jgi:hypothetical protein
VKPATGHASMNHVVFFTSWVLVQSDLEMSRLPTALARWVNDQIGFEPL